MAHAGMSPPGGKKGAPKDLGPIFLLGSCRSPVRPTKKPIKEVEMDRKGTSPSNRKEEKQGRTTPSPSITLKLLRAKFGTRGAHGAFGREKKKRNHGTNRSGYEKNHYRTYGRETILVDEWSLCNRPRRGFGGLMTRHNKNPVFCDVIGPQKKKQTNKKNKKTERGGG